MIVERMKTLKKQKNGEKTPETQLNTKTSINSFPVSNFKKKR